MVSPWFGEAFVATRGRAAVSAFAYRVDDSDRSTDLVLSGEVGLEVADTLTAAGTEAARNSAAPMLIIDLGGVTFIDSTGIGALVAIRTAALDAGKDLRLRSVSARVERLLGITGLTDAFPVDNGEA
jgi:anti-sigma B factor antagonist